MIFPSVVAFSAQIKGTELFMTCVPVGNIREGFLEFNQTAKAPSLVARFVVEGVGHTTDLVHIRSCYNNKYLCRTTSSGSYIVAAAVKPVEDKKAVNCTLFMVKDLGSQVATFTHVQSGYQVASNPETTLPQNIVIGTKPLRLQAVRYGDLPIFPKRVIFKGDNAKYLRCRLQKPFPIVMPGLFVGGAVIEESHEYNEFTSGDGSDRSAHYEIIQYNGIIRVKSVQFDKFLRRNSHRTYNSWIWGDSDDTTINNLDTLFKVVYLGDNVIALRNMGDNKICRRLCAERLENCLKSMETYADVPETRLVVEEPVRSRVIEAKYKFDDAKITSQTLIQKSYKEAKNSSQYARDDELWDSFSYQKIRSTTWNTTTTLTNNVHAEINVDIPKFVQGKFELSGKIEEVNQLEKGSKFSEQGQAYYKINVPPMTKAILRGYVQQVTYDIPYSYIQTDIYTTGEQHTTTEDAGVCQGFDSYNHYYEKEYIPL